MSNPKEALPEPVSIDTIRQMLEGLRTSASLLPEILSIEPMNVTAQYHRLYTIKLAAQLDKHHLPYDELILRIAGRHLPAIKTRNEVATLLWLRAKTTIRVPDVISFNDSDQNILGYEYTLMTKEDGVVLSDVWDDLTEEKQDHVIGQLIDHMVELHRIPWDGIGGLSVDVMIPGSEPTLGRVVDEDFWQTQDIAKYWSEEETVETLNIGGPFKTYLDLVIARVRLYIKLIQKHPSLEFMQDDLPRLDAFIEVLKSRKDAGTADPDRLNQTKQRLVHRDLHFGNILIDLPTADIYAVLDWEFAGVVPFIEWNPHKAFLWNARDGPESAQQKEKLMKRFERLCWETKAVPLLLDAKFSSPFQEKVHNVHNYLRAIVEVCPRGQRQDLVQGWRQTVLDNLKAFGV
ncbi:APH-domain-containing protein [Sarocladium strictum]